MLGKNQWSIKPDHCGLYHFLQLPLCEWFDNDWVAGSLDNMIELSGSLQQTDYVRLKLLGIVEIADMAGDFSIGMK